MEWGSGVEEQDNNRPQGGMDRTAYVVPWLIRYIVDTVIVSGLISTIHQGTET